MKLLLLAILAFSWLILSCKREPIYDVNEDQVLNFNLPPDCELVESFGGQGPYKFTGSIQSNANAPVTFTVKVANKEITRKFEAEDGVFYLSVNFENSKDEGYSVIYRVKSN